MVKYYVRAITKLGLIEEKLIELQGEVIAAHTPIGQRGTPNQKEICNKLEEARTIIIKQIVKFSKQIR